MFKLLSLVVAAYVLHAVLTGRIFAKAGPVGRIISRDESPRYFYVLLSAALLTVF